MYEAYNESVTNWSYASMNHTEFEDCVYQYHRENPSRFKDTTTVFTLCDYGCTNGGSSILPFRALIQTIRKLSPDMPIQIYLNDLPECRFDITFKTVSDALQLNNLQNVYIMAVGKDFTQ